MEVRTPAARLFKYERDGVSSFLSRQLLSYPGTYMHGDIKRRPAFCGVRFSLTASTDRVRALHEWLWRRLENDLALQR